MQARVEAWAFFCALGSDNIQDPWSAVFWHAHSRVTKCAIDDVAKLGGEHTDDCWAREEINRMQHRDTGSPGCHDAARFSLINDRDGVSMFGCCDCRCFAVPEVVRGDGAREFEKRARMQG